MYLASNAVGQASLVGLSGSGWDYGQARGRQVHGLDIKIYGMLAGSVLDVRGGRLEVAG